MPTNNFFSTANEGFVTTLGSSILSGATTVPLNGVSGLTNGSIFVGIIEPGLTKQQVFTGVVDTAGVQITSVVWTRGTNAAHSTGVTIVDYVTGTHHNMTTTGILKHANQDGTMITSLPLTTPKVTTGLKDVNGNAVLDLPATASAVNEVKITNAATTTFPTISPAGSDTNIDLLLVGKGTGNVRFAGPSDGWVAANETWTYASATTFTIAGVDRTAVFAVGDRIKLTQTTVKYFYVVSAAFSTNTTVTITGGSDYTLANAAITLPYYSHQLSPSGFPGVFSYSASASGWTSPTAVTRFSLSGHLVTLHINITGTSNATTASANLPIAASSNADVNGAFRSVDNSATVNVGQANISASASTVGFFPTMASGTWTASGGKTISGLSVVYEV